MFKFIKELLTLKKSIKEKELQLTEIEDILNKKSELVEDIKAAARHIAKTEGDKIISDAKKELKSINEEIAKKDSYFQEVQNLKSEKESLITKSDKEAKKLSKMKSYTKKIKYIIKKYEDLNIFNDNILEVILNKEEEKEVADLTTTVSIKLHNMDVKELRKAFRANDKQIEETFITYEKRYTTKTNKAIYRLMVIALRAELQNVLYNLKYDKLENSIEDIKKITEKYLMIANDGSKAILSTITRFISEIEYLFINATKIEYEYYIKKQQLKEEQAILREKMREEAKERKALEQQRKQIEKEEEKYKNEILKIQELMTQTEDTEKTEQLQQKISELKCQLNSLEQDKDEIVKRQNGKAGYVYAISNLGSFGDKTFKIGMTRRLNPQDRIDELSGASVPFKFDIHSFIFSDDAVSLESELHNRLSDSRVNKINLRKEFFNISIDELQKLVEEINPSAEFNTTMLAEEFRQTLSLNLTDEEISI